MIVFICIGIQAYVNCYFPRKFIANCHSSKTMSLYGMQRISGNISYTLLEQSYMSEAFDWNAFHMYFISSVVEYLRNMCLSVMNISANISSVMIILNSLIWFIVKIWQNTFSMEFLFMEYCCFTENIKYILWKAMLCYRNSPGNSEGEIFLRNWKNRIILFVAIEYWKDSASIIEMFPQNRPGE